MRAALTILVLLLLGAAGFGVVQVVEAKKLRELLTYQDKEQTALQQKIRELEKLNQDLASRVDRGGSTPGPASSQTDAARPGGGAAGGGEPAIAEAPRDGPRSFNPLNNPSTQKLMALQQKAALDGRYAGLFKQLRLDPAALEKFKNLLVEKQSAVMDVMAAARSEGLNPRENRDEIRELVQTTQEELDSSIRSALGASAYDQYKSYEATLPQRGLVDQLGQRLSYSSTPLSDAQAEQMVRLLAATSPSQGGGSNAGPYVQSIASGARGAQFTTTLAAGNVPITDAAIAQARGILSPTQVAALQSLQQEQQASAQLIQEMRAGRQVRPAGTATAPTGSGGG